MKITLFAIIASIFTMNAQDTLPYYQIPDPPKEFTAGTTASRMVDGLGFRYYWATEGLGEKDLAFRPNNEARTTLQTINHILGLSQVLVNATLQKENGTQPLEMTFAEKRKKTLENFQQASTILKTSKDVSQYKLVFGSTELPFWNAINGPIADAIWHVGQIVSFRRSSGNPLPKGVNVLRGTKSK
ncbi:hypothetical protein [Polaribacter sp.]|uniref:hypothetical protein n=1 Tax=Polaribacter sp. TaxID=1920175 RepID=UPI003F6B7EC9